MPNPADSPLRRAADALLTDDGGVARLVADMRANGASWHRIALEIRDKTAGAVEVTPETVRRWGAPETSPAPSAA